MKRKGIAHAELSRQIALLGHADRIVIGDLGLPVPRCVPVVDLALMPGQLPFPVVLDAVLAEIVVEEHIIARESLPGQAGAWLGARAAGLGRRVLTSHEELKRMITGAAFAIRTGEATPYANVILQCGVPF